MHAQPRRQNGASAIATIITLAVLAYGAFVGIQYIPQFLESKSIDSMLEGMEKSNRSDPATSAQAVEDRVHKFLGLNDMEDLADSFEVRQSDDTYIIDVNYERDLNLVYKTKVITYNKSATLD